LDRKKFLVYAYPKKDIWQEQHMEEYVDALRRVDPDVTGAPVQVFESSRLMHEGFLLAALYSFILVFVLLLVDFRSLKLALVTIIPVAVGVFWTLELMPIIGWSFNLANFFALPIMIGCGVDAGVHMVHRFRETRSVAEVGRTTGSAVTLANLSNMVGFASMGIARHQGVASLGLVTALGCFTVLVASVVLLPCFLELLKGRLLPKEEP
ncbi:MAG TPA: MMPL family transporter, partial [Planctomycetota bacterium]|nr:MMPL family transporter [Planctomycetota bacterium]